MTITLVGKENQQCDIWACYWEFDHGEFRNATTIQICIERDMVIEGVKLDGRDVDMTGLPIRVKKGHYVKFEPGQLVVKMEE
jgi:hypothetical protein